MQPKLALDTFLPISEVFQENYDEMLRMADIITHSNKQLSEDLVHDVYLKCMKTNADVSRITNVKSYLYTAIRNTYISQLRRRTILNEIPLVDTDLSDHFAFSTDPRLKNSIHEQLVEICYFACNRKDTSISSSVLILRYIHGYYTSETRRILNRSLNSIDARLSKARSEVFAALKRPEASDLQNNRHKEYARLNYLPNGVDLLAELRRMVFAYSTGRCLSSEAWRVHYRKSLQIGREDLSHLVSCPKCLDSVNRLLRMPLLSERHPLDTRGSQIITEIIERARPGLLNAVIALFLWPILILDSEAATGLLSLILNSVS